MRIDTMKRKEKSKPMSISVPASIKAEMGKHSEINWSGVAAKAFVRQLRAQEVLEQFSEEGVSEEEAIQRGLRLRHKEEIANKSA